ncbi:hypothetical protein [Bradyrhizobium sp. CB3481]|uniref:hypothetical protein n=1 Tax=Bradyrhizobium sp. CB3481 TaxID=3039158 RepID=UPI0024B0C2F7|nr:hypothetical protein [Bradyrhizobium sp. CB3481]WFU18173.1 hypothetical protein QA643_07470 [Bradyrhizobium sp. CB3481]
MNFGNCFGSLPAIGLTVALMTATTSTQTCVGEAAAVQNEALRVAGPSTRQIKVGGVGLRISY